MSKKLLFCVVLLGLFSVNGAHAAWWDCKVDVTTDRGSYGEPLIFGKQYYTEVRREISASRRSEAESKARQGGGYFTKPGLFGGKQLYACAAGVEKHDGETCHYWLDDATCYRQ